MADIASIELQANFQPLTNMKLELDATGIAYSKMIATIERDQKRLDKAMNASASVQIEANKRIMESFTQRYKAEQVAAARTLANNKRIMDSFAREYEYTQRSARGFSHFGQAVQQTGYQVGDFLVQVQSGTNAFVAFGQQATQLAGLIYLINARWAIMVGTIASIAIPLATMLGAYISRTAEADAATRSFANSLQAVRDQIYDLENESSALRLGLNTSDEANLYREILVLRDQLNAKAEEYNNTTTLGGSQRRQMLMDEYQGMLKVYNQKIADLVSMRDRVKALKDEVDSQKLIDQLVENQLAGMQGLASAIGAARAQASTFVGVADTLAGALGRAAAAWGVILGGPITGAPGALERYEASGSADAAARNNSMTMGQLGGRLTGGAGGVRNFGSAGGGGGGGGGSNPIEQELETLRSFLQSEAEVELEAFQQRQDTLRAALEQRMITLEEFNALEKELKIKHNEELEGIDALRYGNALTQAEFVFGELASAAQAGGQKYQKIYKAFAIGEALITGYKAAVSAWEKGMTAGGPGLAAAYTALSLAKTGGLIAGMRSGSSSSGGSSRGSVGRVQSTVTQSPQTVYLSGLDPNALFTGEMISKFFEGFYQENDNRGKVFVVAR